MRVLITGGAGYIGSHTAQYFSEHGHDVWAYDNLSRGHAAAAPQGRLVKGDLSDRAQLEAVLRQQRIEAVIHFAALTYVGESVSEPAKYYRNNVCGTLSLLEAMRTANVQRIVFSSTAAVYGAPKRVPITEDLRLAPINPYGRSKLAVEWMLADHASAYGLGYATLRYFNAAGADPQARLGEDHSPETHLIPLILQTALGHREAIDVFGTDYPTPDGTCIRDYIHVVDLASAHLAAVERLQPGQGNVYNLGTGTGFSVREVIRACEDAVGRSIETRFGPRREGDPPALVASPQKAMTELDWQPALTDLGAIIDTAWRWHRDNPQGYRT